MTQDVERFARGCASVKPPIPNQFSRDLFRHTPTFELPNAADYVGITMTCMYRSPGIGKAATPRHAYGADGISLVR